MTFNYTLSAVMTMGHKIASSVREKHATYKQALSHGLKRAWKIAKGLLPHVEVESAKVITEDVGQECAQRCMGNVVEKVQVAC
jgi:hypothetical protein